MDLVELFRKIFSDIEIKSKLFVEKFHIFKIFLFFLVFSARDKKSALEVHFKVLFKEYFKVYFKAHFKVYSGPKFLRIH
jgi:hypothetical protein